MDLCHIFIVGVALYDECINMADNFEGEWLLQHLFFEIVENKTKINGNNYQKGFHLPYPSSLHRRLGLSQCREHQGTSRVQEAQRVPYKINQRRSTMRPMLIK